MKKSIYFLAAGCALALSACTSEDVVQESARQANAIGFQSAVGKETRAINSKDDLTRFEVYAYYVPTIENSANVDAVQVFNGDAVTRPAGGDTWSYTNTRYWIPGAKYYFYAFSCENTALNSGTAILSVSADNTNARALRINNYVCNDDHNHDLVVASNSDLIGAESSGDPTNPANDKVNFTFKHALTKINVVFSSAFASGYDIAVSDVEVTNVRDKGNYSFASSSWNSQTRTKEENDAEGDYGTSVSFEGFENDENIASKDPDLKATTTSKFVLPYAYTTEGDVKLRFHIDVIDHETQQAILSRDMVGSWAPNWQSGYSYTYNVNITGTNTALEPIVFETQTNMALVDFTTGSTQAVDMTFSAN